MPSAIVEPVIDEKVRSLCKKPYYNHKCGCPNFNERNTCPPHAPMLFNYFDKRHPILAVWITFNLRKHREKMRSKHPKWSRRQLDCCLYWQASLYKRLRGRIRKLKKDTENILIETYVPEAMGVNVTETMKQVGVGLEWPPKNKVRKIAFLGVKK